MFGIGYQVRVTNSFPYASAQALEEMAQDHYRITSENYQQELEKMEQIAERIRTEYDALTAE